MTAPKTLIGFDTETSDLKPELGQVLTMTLLAIDVASGEETDRLDLKVGYRGDVIPQAIAVKVNRINPLRQKGMPETQVAMLVRDFLLKNGGAESPFLGHNVEFDKRFLRNLLTRNGIDSTVVSLKSVDTVTESARLIYRQKFPVDRLQRKPTRDGGTKPSLSQGSVAGAYGIEVDPATAHTSLGDVMVNHKIWLALGKPLPDSSVAFNNPYEVESKLAGKIVKTKEWDGLNAQVVERRYYVVGGGLKEVDDVFGRVKYSGTALIRLDDEELPAVIELVARAEAEELAKAEAADGGSPGGGRGDNDDQISREPASIWTRKDVRDALSRVTRERKFSSQTAFAIDVVNPSEAELEPLLLLSPYALTCLDDSRRSEREEQYTLFLSAAAGEHFALKDPGSKVGILRSNDQGLIPGLAAEMSTMTPEARLQHISDLANRQVPQRGVSWSHNMLAMAERYGYRSGMDGFEDARRKDLRRLMPAAVQPQVLARGLADVSHAMAEAMNIKGIARFELTCNGKDVRIKTFDPAGQELDRRRLDVKDGERGRIGFPLADDVGAALAEMTGASHSAAMKARTDFTPFKDRLSFDAVKASFAAEIERAKTQCNVEAQKVLEECLADFGGTYEEFLLNSKPKLDLEGFAKNAKGVPIAKRRGLGNLKEIMDEADAMKKTELRLIREAYDALAPVRLPDGADSRLIMAANLNNPRVNVQKNLDIHVINSGIALHKSSFEEGGAAVKMEPDVTEPEEVAQAGVASPKPKKAAAGLQAVHAHDDPALTARCKVCNRTVKGKNAVAGMGPICARKLEDWLDRPEIGVSDITKGKFKRLSDVKEVDGILPIMMVRDIKTGRTFAADIIHKEKDGRYLVVDLTELSKEKASGKKKGLIKDTLKVFLDPENHEVARIFGSDSNYYK